MSQESSHLEISASVLASAPTLQNFIFPLRNFFGKEFFWQTFMSIAPQYSPLCLIIPFPLARCVHWRSRKSSV